MYKLFNYFFWAIPMLVVTACSSSANTGSGDNAEEQVTDVIDLPQKFILEEDGLTINSLDDMGSHYFGFGSDGRIYRLSKETKILWDDPSQNLSDAGNTFEISWPISSSKSLEQISFSKDEFLQQSNADGEKNREEVMSLDFDEMEELEEENVEEFVVIAPKLQGDKLTTQNDIFSAKICGQSIIKSSFKPENNSSVDITFYKTSDILKSGYPGVPVQSVVAQIKGEEHPLFIKVFKVDNPKFKYFIQAVENFNRQSEPDDYINEKIDRNPEYTGIIDNNGKVFVISK